VWQIKGATTICAGKQEEINMNLWTTLLFGNPLFQWLVALAVGLVFYALLRLLAWLCRKNSEKYKPQPQPDMSILIKGLLDHTLWLFFVWMTIFVALKFVTLDQAFMTVIETVTVIIILIQLGLWAVEIIEYVVSRRLIAREGEATYKKGPYTAIVLLSKIVVWILVIILVLENIPGIHVTTLIASLGIGGIAIGLALQKILGDLFASLTISIGQPFVEGDAINVGEFSGQVEHVGLKSTRVRSLTGEQLIFSNSDLLDSRIRNYKRMDHRLIVFMLNVTYATSYKKLQKIPGILKKIIEAQPQVTFNRAHFKSYSDSALVFEVAYSTNAPGFDLYMDTQQQINLEIYRRFSDEGIDFAYPTRTVLLGK